MNPAILYASHKTTRNRQGVTVTHAIVCDDTDLLAARPKLGAKHPREANCYCTNIDEEGVGKPISSFVYEQWKLTATYSTFQQMDAAPTESWEFGGEALDTGAGGEWRGTGRSCQQNITVPYPNGVRTLTQVKSSIPIDAILNAWGKLNWCSFLGCPPQTMLFEGASTESWFDYERGVYFYRIHFRFIVRPRSHNTVWRQAEQARDSAGDLMYDDRGPIWALGDAGKAGWDQRIPAFFELGDFNPLFGLPPNPPPREFVY
jgi:hypothetical protein